MDNLVNRVMTAYGATPSLRAAAAHCGISPQKVRKILLSNGVMPDSDTTRAVNAMRGAGMGVAGIAEKMDISAKAAAAHLPYEKAMYRSESPTENALRIRKHRGGGYAV